MLEFYIFRQLLTGFVFSAGGMLFVAIQNLGGVGMGALIGYLPLMGKGLALSGAVPQWFAAWAVTLVGSLVGLVLSWKALWR